MVKTKSILLSATAASMAGFLFGFDAIVNFGAEGTMVVAFTSAFIASCAIGQGEVIRVFISKYS